MGNTNSFGPSRCHGITAVPPRSFATGTWPSKAHVSTSSRGKPFRSGPVPVVFFGGVEIQKNAAFKFAARNQSVPGILQGTIGGVVSSAASSTCFLLGGGAI